MLICPVPLLVGLIGPQVVRYDKPHGRLVCLWISFSYTTRWTLSTSVATANTAGNTKKISVNAILLISYCLGNFVGPFFSKAKQAPQYDLGVAMMFCCIALQIVCISGLWVLLWFRNN